ncbi:MAG: GTPase Era [Gammaproteobacteria bacterium]|nr:GTPase Era [Gammaproteobacteria bacterium]
MSGNPTTAATHFRCGQVAIVGRPNVGKSTLLNHLVGHKLSITSRKPQTTRWNLLGVKTGADWQALYVDTPGIPGRYPVPLNRHMLREVKNALDGVDVALHVIEALRWTAADAAVRDRLRDTRRPVLLVINKIDRLADRAQLLPFISGIFKSGGYDEVVPISARNNESIAQLEEVVRKLLPEAPPAFPEEQLTDRTERFLAAELIREKLTRRLGDELPYSLSVTVDRFRATGKVTHIDATIWVESAGQKAIVIGRGGKMLKAVGEQARGDIEKMIDGPVHLRTWVKVRKRWTDDEKALRQFGYSG